MLTFPIQSAAVSLRGKSPEELPHGLLTPPAEVREIIERERPRHIPEAFAKAELGMLNLETNGWYFDNLCHPVLYRETPEGPEVLAVGCDEVGAFEQQTSPEELASFKTYMGY